MKLPALPIAACVAAGILAANPLSSHLSSLLASLMVGALFFLTTGFVLFACQCTRTAAAASLLAWGCLGAAAQSASIQVPSDRVTALAASGQLNLEEPLRWRGRLRADPVHLPWGLRYDIDLEQVESKRTWIPATGGLRLTYYFNERSPSLPPETHAGDRIETLARARMVRDFGDPGSFDYRGFLAEQDIHLTASLRSAELLERLPKTKLTLADRGARLRGRLLNEIDEMLSGADEKMAVARAMLLGDRSFLDTDEVEKFRETGTYHVLILAGLHVGILAAVLLWAGRKARLPLPVRTLITLAALGAYVIAVEDRPPILRASLMAAIYLFTRLLFRRTAALNVVALAALLIMVMRPAELFDASFLMSFLAAGVIAGIAMPLLDQTAERYRRALNHLGDVTRDAAHAPPVTQFRLDLRTLMKWLSFRLPRRFARWSEPAIAASCRIGLRLWELIVISAAIQIGMMPLMAQYFHRLSLVGLAANVPAVLLTGMIVPVGFVSLFIGLLSRGMARLLAHLLGTLVSILTAIVNWFAKAPLASYRLPSPPPLLVAAFLVALVAFTALISTGMRKSKWAAAAGLAIAGTILGMYPFSPRLHPGELEVTVLDVGQGDSIFVAFPQGRTMLVDGGGLPGSNFIHGMRPGTDVGEEVVSAYLWSRGLKHLDVVALTHAHEDHIGGLFAVLQNFRVGELWVGHDVDSALYHALIEEARARGVRIVHRIAGESMNWDGVDIQVLWPANDDPVHSATNDDSLVLHLRDGNESLLLAGDIERPVERSLSGASAEMAADFLKVPHHGSRTSSTEPFLKAVHPKFAVISVGEANPFGHPNEDVLERLSEDGARVFRTDSNGAVTVLTNGRKMAIHTYFPMMGGLGGEIANTGLAGNDEKEPAQQFAP